MCGHVSLEEVRRIRTGLGLTQGELARRLHVSQSLIAKIEKGDLKPSYEVAKALLGFLGSELRRRNAHVTAGRACRPIAWVDAKDSLRAASTLLARHGAVILPVRRDGLQAGSISVHRINTILASSHQPEARLADPVESAMELPLPTVPEGLPVAAMQPLLQHAGAVLIMRENQFLGVCEARDLLDAMIGSEARATN